MEYTRGSCLGNSCRFYQGKADATCFHQGVLPRCGPDTKAARKRLDDAAPQMYEALKSLLHLAPVTHYLDAASCMEDIHQRRFQVARKSIAKAEGKE